MHQQPKNAKTKPWSWSTKGSKGVLLPLEIETRPIINGLPGIYNFGVLYTNAPQTDLYRGKSGGAGATDPNGYTKHSDTWFMYTGFNQQLTQHASEIPYVFNTLMARYADTVKPQDQAVAAQLNRYWVNFARSSQPNEKNLPEWPAFNRQADNLLLIPAAGAQQTRTQRDPWQERLDLVETLVKE